MAGCLVDDDDAAAAAGPQLLHGSYFSTVTAATFSVRR